MNKQPTGRMMLAWVTAFGVGLACQVVIAADAERPNVDRPNVVLIYCDDLGYGDLGCYGAKGYQTPHLDRLAAAGVRFIDFYVAQAVCTASRTALLTGCYPNRLGMLGALGPQANTGIADSETTLAEVLKSRGYATAIYGKWHLGHRPQFLPTRHGFDDYFGLPYSNDMWPQHPTAKFPSLPLIEGAQTVAENPDQRQLTTQYTQRAVKFIAEHRAEPFFLYVPHSMPHVPIFVSDKFAGKTERGLYGDVIAEIDWSVGQIMAALDEYKLAERTLVIFSSDNGPWLSYGEHGGSAGPLREGKGTAWDGGVRVPCIMRWPGRVPAGSVCREPAMTIDILPTVAKLAGAALPKLLIDGLDIGPLLAQPTVARSPHEALYFYWGAELHALRSGQWKLHFPHPYQSIVGQPRASGGKPVTYAKATTELALYDLATDPGEQHNVAADHADVVSRLSALGEQARVDLGDSLIKRRGANLREPGRVN